MAGVKIRLSGGWPAWGPGVRWGELSKAGGDPRAVLVRLLPDVASDGAAMARLRADGRRLSRVNDPHLLRLLHVSRMSGKAALVHEGFEAVSIARVIEALGARNQLLPVRASIEIAAGVAQALAAVAGGVPDDPVRLLHPGPTPDDVLVDAQGRVKLAGVVAWEAGRAVPNAPQGYGPPEPSVGPDRSAYGLGALLVQLLTGDPPAAAMADPARHEAATRRSLIRVLARPGEGFPDVGVELVRACMAHNPASRPHLQELVTRLLAMVRDLRSAGLRAWAGGAVPALLMHHGGARGAAVMPPAESAAFRRPVAEFALPVSAGPISVPPSVVSDPRPAPVASPARAMPLAASAAPAPLLHGGGALPEPDPEDFEPTVVLSSPPPLSAELLVQDTQETPRADLGLPSAAPARPHGLPAVVASERLGASASISALPDTPSSGGVAVGGGNIGLPRVDMALDIDPEVARPTVAIGPDPGIGLLAVSRLDDDADLHDLDDDSHAYKPRSRAGLWLGVAAGAVLALGLGYAWQSGMLAGGSGAIPVEDLSAPDGALADVDASAPDPLAAAEPDSDTGDEQPADEPLDADLPADEAPGADAAALGSGGEAAGAAATSGAPEMSDAGGGGASSPPQRAAVPAVAAPSAPAPPAPARAAATRSPADRAEPTRDASSSRAPAPARDAPERRTSSARTAPPPPPSPAAAPPAGRADARAAAIQKMTAVAPAAPAAPAPAPAAPAADTPAAVRVAPANAAPPAPAAPAAPAGFRVEFRSGDPTVTEISVRCHQGRGGGPAPLVIPQAGRGPCKVTGMRGDERLVTSVSLTGEAVFTCFTGGARTCR